MELVEVQLQAIGQRDVATGLALIQAREVRVVSAQLDRYWFWPRARWLLLAEPDEAIALYDSLPAERVRSERVNGERVPRTRWGYERWLRRLWTR